MLPRIVGLHRANVMTMLAEKMTAEQAKEWGLVYVVTAPRSVARDGDRHGEDARDAADTWPRSHEARVQPSLGVDLDEQLDSRRSCSARPAAPTTTSRVCNAFLEKRKPVFKGR